jgi:hypothetical protein
MNDPSINLSCACVLFLLLIGIFALAYQYQKWQKAHPPVEEEKPNPLLGFLILFDWWSQHRH